MIHITDKKDCCGCNSCVQCCPKSCITMHEDEEGFLYPEVDESVCIDCGLCEKVCPVVNQGEIRYPLSLFGAYNPNEEVRMNSSSGGVFTQLAEKVIGKGGVVFGARYSEDWLVEHTAATTTEGLALFRGSKYMQSDLRDSYRQVRCFLHEGRWVLFSGTPCQVAGLRLFLHKDYERLILVDFICHGVPSSKVFQAYLNEQRNKYARKRIVGKNTVFQSLKMAPVVTGVNFRDKITGWKKFSFSFQFSLPSGGEKKNSVFRSELATRNLFMKGFLDNLYLRPSCHSCPVKELRSGSDLTIADFWSVAKVHIDMDDDKGTSLVLCNTKKGQALFNEIMLTKVETTYDTACRYNESLLYSVRPHLHRNDFFRLFEKYSLNPSKLIIRCLYDTPQKRLRLSVRDILIKMRLYK